LAYVQIKDARLDTGEVVTSGAGDGELVETIRALHADGFDGFFSLETHLGQAPPSAGSPDLSCSPKPGKPSPIS
jgi:sugar phosphate isomerase/epimerase